MKKTTSIDIGHKLVLLLLVILLFNPIIIFLLSESIWLSLFIPLFFLIPTISLTKRKKLKALSTLWMNLLIVLSFLLHSEVVFTYSFPEYIIEDLYSIKKNYYFNRPYLNKTFQDKEFQVQYKTNSQGFRIGAEDDPEVTLETADWLFIGDSYTQGAQVQYEELYTSKLYERFPDKIILNAGISGLGIVDEYYYYISEGKNLNANKVFLQICNFNDFMHVEKKASGFSDYLMHYSNFSRFLLYDFKYANPAELPLGRWTEPFYPDEKSNRDYNIFYKESSKIKRKDIETFKVYLEKFAKAVKENGAELIIVQIPTKEQVHFKYLNEVIENYNIDINNLQMHFPNFLLSELCKDLSIKHIDLLNDFSSSTHSLFFDFDEHLNVQGHLQIAESISRVLTYPKKKVRLEILSAFNVGDRYPVISIRNSNLMTFQSWRDGNMELFITDTLMQESRRLTWNTIDEIHPWPSPDGDRIAFTEGSQALNHTKVAIMGINGNTRKYITADKDTYGAIPSFNSGGNKLTYAEWYNVDNRLTNPYIIIYDLSTNVKQQITSEEYESWRPIFSSDNSKLFYISKERGDNFDVYEHTIANGTKRNLTKSDFDEWDPAISKDGKRLIYAGRKDRNWDLFMIQFDTGKTTQLTQTKGEEWDPSFSDCGKYVYYAGTFGLRNGIFRLLIE